MDLYRRLGMYFFVFGALLCILAGAFPLADGMFNIIMAVVIFLGVFSALLNITDEEELGFIAASMGLIIALVGFKLLLGSNPLLLTLSRFFEVVTLFVGSMLGVVALKTVLEFGSQNYHGKPLEEIEMVAERTETYLWSQREKTWNFIVFIAVAVSFVAILLDVFFVLTDYLAIFVTLDILITVVFLVDLVVLYKKERTFGRFLRNCWLDIIATIPFFYMFRAASFLRIAKLGRIVKIMRFIKLHKTLKFFSEKSGMKHYLRTTPDHDKLKAEANALIKEERQVASARKTAARRRPVVKRPVKQVARKPRRSRR